MTTTVLMIEDDLAIVNFMTAILQGNAYKVLHAAKGTEGVSMCALWSPDVVILDLGLPDQDGIDVLKNIRSWSEVPIIVVSARSDESEKVLALDEGADDYITKPFGTSELLARIRTALRHVKKKEGSAGKLSNGAFEIDFDKRFVQIEGKQVHLTPTEYKIIQLLALNIGKVLTHDYIAKEVWGPYSLENQSLRVNMSNIRRKIEVNPAEPVYILTEIGVGYRMVEC
ncbi:response regulator [Isobaculum melis]|uniref:Two component transcriptional regulator, winged helix family n=1 Tax=Isobaculum melis TaxID=142588 RepID=A0A1H9TFT2_9LACT|nr:response regulator transcription factor [Isobaculum melis]SER96001.1 two component transcriptional regulator, winged helix family [Isobaculum melis]